MMELLLIFSFTMLFYVYGGYLVLLRVLAPFMQDRESSEAEDRMEYPFVTVLITVFNEVEKIEGRIENVLECEYPESRLEILVASDGSTDGTDAKVLSFGDTRVRLFRPDQREGKSDTQNQAIGHALGEIIVFTDADTRFDKQFLVEIVRPFRDPQVGGGDGHLLFETAQDSDISQSQSIYWKQELEIRILESRMKMLAVASGACLAVRRFLFRPIPPFVGEDCVIPLDVVSQGYRMVHVEKAVAYDWMDHSSAGEFSTRVRMTLRNWQGTWLYPGLLNPLRNPRIAFALWSHKLLRWLSPVFLLLWLGSSFAVIVSGDGMFRYLGLPGVIFTLLGVIGALANYAGKSVRIASAIYSFFLANSGFFVGVFRALLGGKIVAYR
ncbi:MAG: glycosyltransferase [Methanobacteriota archaeon]|nr:MAG: glycosyltransferase [Euryarchaeota archaeon]